MASMPKPLSLNQCFGRTFRGNWNEVTKWFLKNLINSRTVSYKRTVVISAQSFMHAALFKENDGQPKRTWHANVKPPTQFYI
jgi:hypothetical protein